MLKSVLHEIMQEMHASIRALNAASAEQAEGWRHEVVRHRRMIADQMRRMGGVVASAPDPVPSTLIAFRNTLSRLRSTVAELQASWPAVALDPKAPSYRRSVELIRADLVKLEEALLAYGREPSHVAA